MSVLVCFGILAILSAFACATGSCAARKRRGPKRGGAEVAHSELARHDFRPKQALLTASLSVPSSRASCVCGNSSEKLCVRAIAMVMNIVCMRIFSRLEQTRARIFLVRL